MFPRGRDAVRIRANRSRHDSHRSYDARIASRRDFSFAGEPARSSEGKWTVTEDRTAAAGKVIEQISTDRTDYRFPLAIHESLSAANVDVEVRFKAVAGKTDQAGGIAVRLTDADNYYVARANALEDNVRFYRVVAGRREQLDGANLRVSPE